MSGSNRRGRPAVPCRCGAPRGAVVVATLAAWLLAAAAAAQQPAAPGAAGDRTTVTPEGLVNLDFQDVEIATIIDTIARLTGRNFVYDDRVRGRVTIISPTPIPVEQAYTVFESVLQVKGFTTVEAPGGVIKVIPIRDAKETSVDTRAVLSAPESDRFVTRLIPLQYIDAEEMSNTLKPLVSKEAALVAYTPTNTLILTDSASNINRVLQILEAIDVETHKEELAMIRVQYADAQALAEQLSEVFGGEVSSSTGAPTPGQRVQPRVRRGVQPAQAEPVGAARNRIRIITDARTNALIILAARSTLDEMRALIRKLDVPVEGQGRIQVYYLKHADAEELADTLNTLLGAAPTTTTTTSAAVAAGLQPQQLRSVSEIANLVSSVTADVGTNSLVIQASPEGFEALRKVIEQLDIERPQVLVEALIMEVGVTDSRDLGLSWLVRAAGPDVGFTISQALDSATGGLLGNATRNQKGDTLGPSTGELPFGINIAYLDGDNVIQAVLRATASDNEANIIAAPHILTSDNEEAEILIGDNIPIITNRVQSAQGIVTDPGQDSSLATSVNVERQDIGVTLRVTPQITEGDSLRLEIFQEITDFNDALTEAAGFDPNQTGPALSNRRVENVVVAKDGSTVVIGGLIRDRYSDNTTKVPWLGDIPVLGWLFKSSSTSLQKTNLLIFLTPHIIRSPADLEKASIGKREEFRRRSQQQLAGADERDREVQIVERPIGILAEADTERDRGPAASALKVLERHYPLERMRAIEREQAEQREAARQAAARGARGGRYVVLAGRYSDPEEARATLTELVDAGYDGSLLSSGPAGQVRYELRIGPYEELDQAERAANTLQRAYGLSAQIVVERREGPP